MSAPPPPPKGPTMASDLHGERVPAIVGTIWDKACEGREGYCSSDLQDAAKWAIAEAFRVAEAAARNASLPADYIWSESNREKFEFGRDSAADAILALFTASPSDGSGEGK